MAAAPAVRAAVKTELSYRNDTVIIFFFKASQTENNAKVALASSNSEFENSGFNLKSNIIFCSK